tara:strand:+ start:2481 stop:2708 length:228 start_codon:yes stop_codon:yes gene_type:complete
MDNKINIINNKIEKLKYKYPNITNMWKKYINIRKTNLVESIDICLEILNKLESEHVENDIPQDVIFFMYLLNNTT